MTAAIIFFFTLIAFAGGVGTPTPLLQSFKDIGEGVLNIIRDASWAVSIFPSSLKIALVELEGGVNASCNSIISAVDYNSIRASFGSPAVIGNVAVASSSLKTIVENASTVQANIVKLNALLAALQSYRSTFTTVFGNVNGPFSAPGKTFTTSTSITFSAVGIDTFITDFQNQLSSFPNEPAFVASCDFPNSTAYYYAAKRLSSSWTNITQTVLTTLTNRALNTSSQLMPPLHDFTLPTLEQAYGTSNSVNSSIAGFEDTVNTFLTVVSPHLSAISKVTPVLLVFSLVVVVLYFVFYWFKKERFIKLTAIPITAFGGTMLVLGGIVLLVVVIIGDLCAIIDNNRADGLAALEPSLAKSIINFSASRQNNCIEADLGLIKFAVDVGLVTREDANLTLKAKPTIDGFDLRPLGYLLKTELTPPETSEFLIDRLSTPLATFQSGFSQASFTSLSSISYGGSSLTALSASIQSLIDNINANSGSNSLDADFTGTGGVSFVEAASAITPLSDILSNIASMKSTMVTMSELSSVNAGLGTGMANAATSASAVSASIPGGYVAAKSIADAYADSSTVLLSSNIEKIRFLMLKSVDIAQEKFFSMLSCKDFGYDSLAVQNAICVSFLFPADAIWYSLCCCGLAFAICIYTYRMQMRRLLHPDLWEMTLGQCGIKPFGPFKSRQGQVSPKNGKEATETNGVQIVASSEF